MLLLGLLRRDSDRHLFQGCKKVQSSDPGYERSNSSNLPHTIKHTKQHTAVPTNVKLKEHLFHRTDNAQDDIIGKKRFPFHSSCAHSHLYRYDTNFIISFTNCGVETTASGQTRKKLETWPSANKLRLKFEERAGTARAKAQLKKKKNYKPLIEPFHPSALESNHLISRSIVSYKNHESSRRERR